MANCKENHAAAATTFLEKLSEFLDDVTLHYVCESYRLSRFQAGYGSMDWSLETGVGADCAVVRRLTSYSDTLAPVSAASQPDRRSALRQSRESGRKHDKCLTFYFKTSIHSSPLLLWDGPDV